MPEESTAVTTLQAVAANHAHASEQYWPPCLGCGLRNPVVRRSCLACGAPLGSHEDVAGPLPIDPPLLERDEQTRAIDGAVDQFIASRRGTVVAITGPLGTGTTRLLRYTAERLLATEKLRIYTTTVRDSDGPYAPMTRLLWERFGVTPSKGLQSARTDMITEVNRVLANRGGPPTEHARRIVITAGLPSDTGPRWESEASRTITRLADSVARFLRADAEESPVALLVDNLHVATDDGLAVFQAVLNALAESAVLVVVAGEPEVRDRLGRRAVTIVEPSTLSPEASASLTRHLLPGVPDVPDELLQSVIQRGGGIPGQIREILLALIESGAVVTDEIPWRIDVDALGLEGPASSGDIVDFRLDRLDDEARAVLARGAIVGEVFWEGAVIAMSRVEHGGDDPFGEDRIHAEVTEALRRLVAAELLSPIEESELALERQYAFTLVGVRERLLRDQDDAIRRSRHDICASWLELAAGPRAEDLSRAIAGHLERAGLAEAAGRAYLRAARAARASYRGPQAVQLFDKALALLPPGDAPARLDALHDRGVVLSLLGRVDEAVQAFTSMLTVAHRYGARSKMAAALGRLGRLARGRGDLAQSHALLVRALELFQHAEDVRGVAAVEDDLGMIAYLTGDFETALAHSTRALEIRRELDDPLGEALSTHNLGLVHFARGQPRQARAHFERALALREKHGDIEGAVNTRNVLAAAAWERGEREQAEESWTQIRDLAEALGDRRMIVAATTNLGEAAAVRGDVGRATQLLDTAEQVSNEIGDVRALVEIERIRGVMARAAGEVSLARPHFERSLTMARATGLREPEALALRGLGEVCATTVFDETGESAHHAEAYFQEAIQILEELGATRELAKTRAVHGQCLLERGDVMNGRLQLTLAVPVLERLELVEAGPARLALQRAGGDLVFPGKP